MKQQEVDELLEMIAEKSHELCGMIEVIQSLEGRNPSAAWLCVFEEITRSWFEDNNDRLKEIADFVTFGAKFNPTTTLDLRNMIYGPGPLTNH